MEYGKLTVLLYRLFDEISLLRNQGTRAGSQGDFIFYDCGSRVSGMVI